MIQILTPLTTNRIEKSLREQFGIEEINGKMLKLGEEKLFLFTGDASDNEIKTLEKIVPVERIGVYFAKVVHEDIKLSIEGTQILKNQIKKNIFEVDETQAREWMEGSELNVKTGKKGFVAIKYKDNFLGCGKASEEKIGNFVPKMRRLKRKEFH
ncbi:MAG TPA: hypothetical protein VMC07_01645 [Candidatus Omnitrophota bacterium]|nr:hypothetical protein [Candidatus Omnitrophota bacterium]